MTYFIEPDKCIACGLCLKACPAEAITKGKPYTIDPDICTGCGYCAEVCPKKAMTQDAY